MAGPQLSGIAGWFALATLLSGCDAWVATERACMAACQAVQAAYRFRTDSACVCVKRSEATLLVPLPKATATGGSR